MTTLNLKDKLKETATKVRKIEEYRAEIDRLLKERPEYIPFQLEIERLMNGAVTFDNKVAILTQMMNDKKRELLVACRQLEKELGKLKASYLRVQIDNINKGDNNEDKN